jgi:hypothetical protein
MRQEVVKKYSYTDGDSVERRTNARGVEQCHHMSNIYKMGNKMESNDYQGISL